MANPLFGMYGNAMQRTIQQNAAVAPTMQNYNAFNISRPISSFNQQMPAANQGPMMQAMNSIQTLVPSSNMIWVDSIDEIAAYPTGRGWQQWFGDKNNPYLYVRETDANGVIQPLRRVRFQIEDNAQPNVQEGEIVNDDAGEKTGGSNSPSREEFDKLSKIVSELSGSVGNLVDKLGDLLK